MRRIRVFIGEKESQIDQNGEKGDIFPQNFYLIYRQMSARHLVNRRCCNSNMLVALPSPPRLQKRIAQERRNFSASHAYGLTL